MYSKIYEIWVRHIKKCIVCICILSVELFGKVYGVILLYYSSPYRQIQKQRIVFFVFFLFFFYDECTLFLLSWLRWFSKLLMCHKTGVAIRFRAKKKNYLRPAEILHWYNCCADGRSVGWSRCTITWLPNFLGWIDLLSYGATPRSSYWQIQK